VAINSGSKLWIISEEISINILTPPNTQTPAGMRPNVENRLNIAFPAPFHHRSQNAIKPAGKGFDKGDKKRILTSVSGPNAGPQMQEGLACKTYN